MTSYAETPHVAHVMQFRGRGTWTSVCAYGPDLDFASHWERDKDRLGHLRPGEQPERPWCRFCQRRIALLADDVLGTGLSRAQAGAGYGSR